MSGFVQIVEFHTSRIDELRTLAEEMNPQSGGPMLRRTVTADRDRRGHYFTILQFDSYESAMEASTSPQVSEFAARMAALCDAPPTFHNLEVIDTWTSESSGPSKTSMVAGAATAAGVAAAAAAAAKTRSGEEVAREREVVDVEYTEVTAVPPAESVEYTEDQGRL